MILFPKFTNKIIKLPKRHLPNTSYQSLADNKMKVQETFKKILNKIEISHKVRE